MKVAITGGSGFIGTNLIDVLSLDAGNRVINLDIEKPKNLAHLDFWHSVDVCDLKSVESVLYKFKPDYLIHLAARTDLDGDTLDTYKTNFLGVENIVYCANSLRDLKRVIFVSSMLVCRLGYSPLNDVDYNPDNFYGESKVIGEKIVRKNMDKNKSWMIVRPTSIWGPWFRVPYRNFFDAILSGVMILPNGCDTKRSYGFVLNSVGQLLKLLNADESDVNGQTFYLCDYEPLSLSGWALKIQLASNSPRIKHLPLNALKVLALVGDFLKLIGVKHPPLSSKRLNNMLTDAIYDTDSLKRICGPSEIETGEAIELTLDWLRSSKT